MSLWGEFFKPQIFSFYLISFFLVLITPMYFGVEPKVSRLKGIYRIGPHNIDIISIIFGSLLGDAHAEKRLSGLGTRISFFQEGVHVQYLLYLHKMLSELGYCNPKIPVITNRLGTKGKVRKIIRFSTWYYTSFDWIHAEWYSDGIKRVPKSIGQYLTPLCLAVWISNNWARNSQGLSLKASHSYEDCILLNTALYDKFRLETTILSTGAPSKYTIIFRKESLEKLQHITSSSNLLKYMGYKLVRDYSARPIPQQRLKSIHPWFITGFSDAEASFMVFVNKNSIVKLGFQIQACFQIGLHEKDRALLEMIQFYFKGVGNISKQGKDLVQYRVTSQNPEGLEIIVEHFENYPLITQKKADFELLKQVIEIIKNKEHLTEKGLAKIVSIKASMNNGLSDELMIAFPNVNPTPRPFVVDQTIKDSHWIAGFVSGEGSFIISIFKSNTRTGYAVR